MPFRRTAALAIAASALAVIPAAQAGARPVGIGGLNSFDRELLADVNDARLQRGIQPLNISSRLTPIAAQWAQQIASAQRVSDNPHLRAELNAACPRWRKVGENAGIGSEGTADDLFSVYLHNSAERHQMLSPAFTAVGVRSVLANDNNGAPEEWNVMDFAKGCS